ncbi:MAG: hypothetical protein AB2L13_05140 [Spirochaetota bacterium]|jgi:hypothetical protein
MLSAQFVNTVLVIAAAAIALFIIYHIVKGILKLAAIVLLLLLLYAGYLSYTGEKLPGSGEEMMRRLSEKVDVVRERGDDLFKTILRAAPETKER